MKYKKLGKTDIDVSLICLGTMMWGDQVDEGPAHQQIEYALDRGVNFVDTAELYTIPAKAETQGNTERIIGNWIEKNPGRRKDFLLASKVVGTWADRGMNWIRGGRHLLNKKNIHEALDLSLKRLKTDYLDLYQIHWPDRTTNNFGVRGYAHKPAEDNVLIEETLSVLNDLVKEGKIRHIGISNETPWGMMQFLNLAKEKGYERIVSVQNPYNLLNRLYEVGCAEISIREECGLLAYSPLGYGVLSGKYLQNQVPKGSRFDVFPTYGPRFSGTPQAIEATEKYVEIAKRYGFSPVQLALAFVNSRDFTTSNIIGATNLNQLKENIDTVNITLSDECLQDIETVQESIPNPCP
ncbi:aldo/keto reductase [Candidatus Gracilibacteria bacterium]|nr:aldo/keto reductase [Candidatus Gracilibacteria bacterium]